MPVERRFAVLTLAVCFVLGLTGRGLVESFVVFVLPLSASFGWDRAQVVSIYSLSVLASGASGPFVGRIFDRAGPRVVYLLGLGLLSGGLYGASFAAQLWHLQLCIGLGVGFGAACLGNVAHATLIRRWFRTRLTLATSLVFSAFGIGILVVVPLAQMLVDWDGWRQAFRTLATGAFLLLLATALIPWRRLSAGRPDLAGYRRSEMAASHPWTLLTAIRHSGFWGIFSVYFFTSVAMFAIVVQVIAYLVAIGFRPIDAATAWGFTGMLLPAGMILVGWLDGLIGRRPSVLLSFGISFLGIVLLWLLGRYPSFWLLAGFVICFGGMLGSRGPLLSTIGLKLFAGPQAATIFGAMTIGAGAGSAIGALSGGLLHDWTGSYDAVIAFACVNVLLACLPFFIVPALRDADASR